MVTLWQILVLAVVQGVTEFLPISSSGHNVIVGRLMGIAEIGDLNIVLHVGTLLSILVFYWQRVQALLGEDRRLIGLLALGTVPAVAVGLPLKKWGPEWLESPLVAGVMLIVTGVILIVISRVPYGKRPSRELRAWEAGLIGCAQAAAILPGLSRSGSTIAAGLARGLAPASAATFSFLLAIPIIAGGGLYELLKISDSGTPSATPHSYLLIGATVSFLVGWASLHVLSRVLERGRLDRFAWWCIPLGALVIAWQLAGP